MVAPIVGHGRSPMMAGLALLVGATLGSACGHRAADEDAASSDSDLGWSRTKFDKNSVIDDASFIDTTTAAPDTSRVQQFLERTPFRNELLVRTKSPLATYRDGGKLASEILTAAGKKHRINPIELLVALEAEQSLVSAKVLDRDAAKVAFRCGCPDGDECKTSPQSYVGFTKQVECYAGTMRAALDAQRAGKATKAGWKRGAPHPTEDQPKAIVVTPVNAATAALYSYTPIVGKLGGGDKQLGGVSKHWELWRRFAQALSYKGPAGSAPDSGSGPLCTTSAECSGKTPVCDPELSRCVGCGADYAANANALHACPDADLPACTSSGACVICSETNTSVCEKSGTTPSCVSSECGCANDVACGAGKICDDGLGPAGLCVVGCRVVAGDDSCGPTARCSATDGQGGTCQPLSCTTEGCPKGLFCDESLEAPACVECTATNKTRCSAEGDSAGAACVAGRCGCVQDPDCGAGRTCDVAAHTCMALTSNPDDATAQGSEGSSGNEPPAEPPPESAPSSGETTKQPPSGHGSEDRSAPVAPEPQFAPLSPPPEGGGVGCSAAAVRTGGHGVESGASSFAGLGLATAVLALVRRGGRRRSQAR